jgi:hypothetical protein
MSSPARWSSHAIRVRHLAAVCGVPGERLVQLVRTAAARAVPPPAGLDSQRDLVVVLREWPLLLWRQAVGAVADHSSWVGPEFVKFREGLQSGQVDRHRDVAVADGQGIGRMWPGEDRIVARDQGASIDAHQLPSWGSAAR